MLGESNPKIIVFASGTEEGGGSGFANLIKHARSPWRKLTCDVVAVVSNHQHGGVFRHAEELGIPFICFDGPWNRNEYQKIVQSSGAEWVVLSGWLKHISGLDPRRIINIHPALLSSLDGRFGGDGMYGIRIHKAVHAAFKNGDITHSGISMHFVTDEYDAGPVFFEHAVPLTGGMDPVAIQRVVQTLEHHWQPRITNMVIHEEIAWDGVNPDSLIVPSGYQFLPQQ